MIISFNTGKVETKGGTGLLQQKRVEITNNGLDVVVPDAGYDGLSTVYVKTDIAEGGGSSFKDFSTLGYDEDLTMDINNTIDADIEYAKEYKDGFVVTSNTVNIKNTDLVYFPVIDFGSATTLSCTINKYLSVIPHLELENMKIISFSGSTNLRKVDCADWDLSSATTLKNLFDSCNIVDGLDVSKWNLSNVTDLSYCFNNCTKLSSLDVSSWAVGNVTNMKYIFYNCQSITEIKGIENWNVSSLKDFSYSLSYTYNLDSIDLSEWDTISLTTIKSLFSNSDIKSINLSGWNVSKITDFSECFKNCDELTDLNISGWDLSLDKEGYYLPFYDGIPNLTNLVFGYNRKRNMSYFSSSKKLTVDSLLSIFNGLYDFTTAGETPTSTQGKVVIGSTNLAKLTDEQKAIATSKGWTLS